MTNKQKFIETLFNPDDRIAYCEILKAPGAGKETKKAIIKNNKIITRKELLSMPWPVGASVGINPVKPGVKSRSNENVKTTKTILIDIDGKPLPKKEIFKSLPIQPAFIFSRDEKHHHLYFLLEETERTKKTDQKYSEITKILIDILGGDKAVKDPARMVRLPFCPHPSGGEYSINKDIKTGKIIRHNLDEIQTAAEPGAECIEDDATEKKPPQKILDLIAQHYNNKQTIQQGGGRSLLLLHIGFDCHAWGIKPKHAEKLAAELNEKLCDPPENKDIIKHQIQSAYKYAKNQFGYLRQSIADANDQGRRRVYRTFQDSQHVRSVMSNYVYITQAERLVRLDGKLELTSKGQIENHVAHETGIKKDLRSIMAEKLFNVCEYLDFIPYTSRDGDQRIITNPVTGEKTYNRFEPILNTLEGETDPEAVQAFTEHLKYLTNTPEEFQALLNFLAYLIQHPGKKLPYALLIISQKQGIGKSILELLFKNIFRTKTDRQYIGSVENEELQTGWTEYLKDRLVCFVHELAQKDRYNTMNRLKNMITEPEIMINGKYARTYTTKNTTNLIMFSNRENAIHIDKEDRRLLVIYNNKDPKPQKYYNNLVNVFTHRAGDIYRYLHQIDLSAFNPHERPIMTAGKKQLIDQGRNELDIYLDGLAAEKRGPFAGNIFSPLDILQYTQMDRSDLKPSIKSIRAFLIEVAGNPENNWAAIQLDTKRNGRRISRQIWGDKAIFESRGQKNSLFDKYLDKYLAGVEGSFSGLGGAGDSERFEGSEGL